MFQYTLYKREIQRYIKHSLNSSLASFFSLTNGSFLTNSCRFMQFVVRFTNSPIGPDTTQRDGTLRGQLVHLLRRLEEEHVDQQHIVGPVVVFKGVALPLIVLGALQRFVMICSGSSAFPVQCALSCPIMSLETSRVVETKDWNARTWMRGSH